MFNRFTKDARRIVEDAVGIARGLGASTVEAEHLLLAAARGADAVAGALEAHGLDYEGLLAALAAERDRSLAAVGVAAGAPAFSPFLERPSFATSAKTALEHALKVALERSDRHIGAGHVALGTLRARHGTLPRALALAGADRNRLGAAIAAATQ